MRLDHRALLALVTLVLKYLAERRIAARTAA